MAEHQNGKKFGVWRDLYMRKLLRFFLVLSVGAARAVGQTPMPFLIGHPWPTSSQSPTRASNIPIAGPDDPSLLGPPWPFSGGAAVLTAPVLDSSGNAYFALGNNTMQSIAPDDSKRWNKAVGALVQSTPTIFGSEPPIVYFGSNDGVVRAWTLQGVQRWSLPPGIAAINSSPIRSSPAVAVRQASLNRVYVTANSGKVYGIFEQSPSVARHGLGVQRRQSDSHIARTLRQG
jgi:hypothetical protein